MVSVRIFTSRIPANAKSFNTANINYYMGEKAGQIWHVFLPRKKKSQWRNVGLIKFKNCYKMRKYMGGKGNISSICIRSHI